jgi:hypothetical protein
MKKLLLTTFLLASCATGGQKPLEPVKQVQSSNVESRLNDIDSNILKLEYYIAHDKCFTSYAVCMVDKKKNCWSQHEQCVIAVYNQYKKFLK